MTLARIPPLNMTRRNTGCAEHTSGHHRLVLVADLDSTPAGHGLWQSSSPPLSAARQQLLAAIGQAIETRLTPLQREAVQLFFFEGLSQGQIARRLGVSQQVVHKRLYGDRREGRRVGGAMTRLRSALAPLWRAEQEHLKTPSSDPNVAPQKP